MWGRRDSGARPESAATALMLALMPRPRGTLLTVGAALAWAALTGCGGPEEVSAEQLVSKGDEICRQGQERFAEIQPHLPGNASEAVDQTKALEQEAEDELNELRDLQPPDDLRETYDRYLEARGRALEFFRRGVDAAEAQDGEAYIAAQSGLAKGAAERRQLAAAVGFTVCSKAPAGQAAG
jgi:hypothetical protein